MRAGRWVCWLWVLQEAAVLLVAGAGRSCTGCGSTCGEPCHTAAANLTEDGECYKAVAWAMEHGVVLYPNWYPGLNASSSFEDFQLLFYCGGYGERQDGPSFYMGCGRPCPRPEPPPPCAAPCHDAEPGEECHERVQWAMQHGFPEHPEWYLGLNASSTFPDFQELLFRGGFGPLRNGLPGYGGCRRPCRESEGEQQDANATCNATTTSTTTTAAPGFCGIGQWEDTAEVTGGCLNWCKVNVPSVGWTLEGCRAPGPPVQVTVLTYNLYWWSLFGRSSGGSAPAIVGGREGAPGLPSRDLLRGEPFDLMGFQECNDVTLLVEKAGLQGRVGFLQGSYALAIMYRLSAWELVSNGLTDVAEDRPSQWYGRRGALWARLRHTASNKTVFFVNHHGPLPLNSGGRCGQRATAFNLMHLMSTVAEPGDALVLVGDFNANSLNPTLQLLEQSLHKVASGPVFGGVDHIFCSCAGSDVVATSDLGTGGSDHHALAAELCI